MSLLQNGRRESGPTRQSPDRLSAKYKYLGLSSPSGMTT
jgi:hypothetical protein